jgi:hypothetical protein
MAYRSYVIPFYRQQIYGLRPDITELQLLDFYGSDNLQSNGFYNNNRIVNGLPVVCDSFL